MAQSVILEAETRISNGTGDARATRRSGLIPCIIYGNKEEPMLISVSPNDLQKQLSGPGFFARVFEIDVKGQKHKVLARDLQLDPVTDMPIHVDFMRFSATTLLNIDVQVLFGNHEESPGLKRGGVLNVVRHTIELRCKPDDIPESIFVDLSGLEIGDNIHISQVKLPDNTELTISDRDFTIATIAAPTLLVETDEVEDTEGEEGEAEEGAATEESEVVAEAEAEEKAEGEQD